MTGEDRKAKKNTAKTPGHQAHLLLFHSLSLNR